MKKIAHLIVLDKSSSMSSISQSIIDGFNKTLLDIIELDKKHGTNSTITLVQFNEEVSIPLLNKEVSELKELDGNSYRPNGMTALNDAIGDGIKYLEDALGEELNNTRVKAVILTDGYENSSKKYNGSQAKQLIEDYKKNYDWDFTFIGGNLDAATEASKYGIAATKSIGFATNHGGTKRMFDTYSSSVSDWYEQG